MVGDLRITGANQLADLARDLKAAGNVELRRDLLKGIQKVGKERLKPLAIQAARDRLPHEGGLNEFVATGKFAVRTRTSSGNPGIRLTGAKSGHDVRALDRGIVRHPTFGNTGWVTQRIVPGWWSQTLSDQAVLGPVRQELVQVIDDVARRLARG